MFTALTPEEQRERLEGVRELCALLREDGAALARVGETAREPPATRTPEEAGQAEKSDPGPGHRTLLEKFQGVGNA